MSEQEEEMNLCVLMQTSNFGGDPYEEKYECCILDSRFPTTTSTTTTTTTTWNTNITTTTSITSATASPLCVCPHRIPYYVSCVSLGSKLYLINDAYSNPHNITPSSNLHIIDTGVPNCIQQGPSMIEEKVCSQAVSMNGKIYIFGTSTPKNGDGNKKPLAEVFDPMSSKWSELSRLPSNIESRYRDLLSCVGYAKHNKIIVLWTDAIHAGKLDTVLCYYDVSMKSWGYMSDPPLDYGNDLIIVGDELYVFNNYKLLVYNLAQGGGTYAPVSGLEEAMHIISNETPEYHDPVCFCHLGNGQLCLVWCSYILGKPYIQCLRFRVEKLEDGGFRGANIHCDSYSVSGNMIKCVPIERTSSTNTSLENLGAREENRPLKKRKSVWSCLGVKRKLPDY